MFYTLDPLTTKVLNRIQRISKENKNITLCWIPSHIGIQGNDKADSEAKKAINKKQSNTKIPYTDLRPTINKLITDKWQQQWNSYTNNKLQNIKPTIGEWQPGYRKIRKEEVILARLRIGHTQITHNYLLKNEEPPICTACEEQFTVKHILLNCIDLSQIQAKHYQANNLKELFNKTKQHKIIQFLKEARLYLKI